MMNPPPVIKLENVTKVFCDRRSGNARARPTSPSRSQRGDYVSIAGPSGCGKSTLLSIRRPARYGRPAAPTG